VLSIKDPELDDDVNPIALAHFSLSLFLSLSLSFLFFFLYFAIDRIQTTGLGGLKPNTVIFGWPNSWRQSTEQEKPWRVFIDTIYATAANKMALIVPKGISFFPESNEKVLSFFSIRSPIFLYPNNNRCYSYRCIITARS